MTIFNEKMKIKNILPYLKKIGKFEIGFYLRIKNLENLEI